MFLTLCVMVFELQRCPKTGKAFYFDAEDATSEVTWATNRFSANVYSNSKGGLYLQSPCPGWLRSLRSRNAMCDVRIVQAGGGATADTI